LYIDIDDGDGDESISNGNDESKHKEVASTATAATQFAAYSTISSIESTTTTYSTAQTITTYTNLINNLEDFAISTTPAPPEVEEDKVFESADDVSSCAPEVLVEKSIVLPFYYQLETITFDEELLDNVGLSLTAAMCSMYNDRRLGDVNTVVGWNSNPTDVVSDTCIPSNQEAEFCHVVEGGMTIYYENDDEEAIKSYGYEQIEDNFGSLVVDDPRVVDITYIGKDLPNGTSTTTNAVSGADMPDSLFPTPLVATAGALLLGLMAGMYHISRGRIRKKESPAVDADAALPEAPPEAKLDDKSLSSATPIVSNRKEIVLGEDMGGNHYSNAIDVHTCKSAYCKCNSKLIETTFLSTHLKMGRGALGALPLDAVEV
jgi:hypothetical protein